MFFAGSCSTDMSVDEVTGDGSKGGVVASTGGDDGDDDSGDADDDDDDLQPQQ